MRRPLLPIACLLLLVASAWPTSAQSWKGRGRMAGEVTDPEDRPVAGARVTLRLGGAGPEALTTNKKGRFSILGLARGEWEITIEADGFMISKGTVSVSETASGPAKPVPIRLRPLEEAIPEPLSDVEPGFSAREAIEEGNRLLLAEDYAAARDAYEKALPNVESESRGAVLRGIAATWHGEQDDDRAIAILEQVVADDPEDLAATRMLIGLLLAADRDEAARELMARLPEDVEIDAAASLTLGIDLYNEGNLAAALEQFERVVLQHPEMPEGYYYRGLIFLNQGNHDAARADFERFLEIGPSHPKADEVRGFIDYLSGA